MSKVTLKEVAEAAGISATTASRVLNGQSNQARIPAPTVEAVLNAARELGYASNKRFFKPDALRTRTIGLIIPDLSHYFLSRLARTVVERARDVGLSVIVSDSLEDTETEEEMIEQMAAREIDGLMLLPVGRDWGHVRELSRRKLPMVLMDRIRPDVSDFAVCVDNFQSAYRATELLFERGHRSIACIQRLPDAWINEERVRGFREAHRAHGVELDPGLILGEGYGRQNGYLEVKRLLNSTDRPTAIFALSHIVTLEALRAIRDHGLTVPGDVSLIGFDDLPHAEFFSQPVTTMRQPIEEMARMSVDLLIEQIETPSGAQPMTIQLPCELIQRDSVRTVGLPV